MTETRKSLTKTQLKQADAVELLCLCRSVTSDGRIDDGEVSALHQWLAAHKDLDLPAAQHLREVISQVLSDGVVTSEEFSSIQLAVEAVLPPDLRREAMGVRKQVVKAEREARRPLFVADSMIAGAWLEGRQRAAIKVRESDSLRIARQPGNPHDRNAIAVLRADGSMLGYLPREDAGDLATELPDDARYIARAKKILSTSRGRVPVVRAEFFAADAPVSEALPVEQLEWAGPSASGFSGLGNQVKWLVAAVFILMLFIVIGTAGAAAPSSEPELQAKRQAFISVLIEKKIFDHVEGGAIPRLWVRPAFYALDFTDKTQFVNVVWAHQVTANPKVDYLAIYDVKTGQRIGSYSEMGGGLKLE